MAGELWRSTHQIGKETTPGTAVAATRKMYFTEDSTFKRERSARPKRFSSASRQSVRAMTLGPTEVGGNLVMPLSASEIIEALLMTIRGGVTPTGAGDAKLWTFTPGETLDPVTMQWHDGARAWHVAGCYGNKLRIAGNVRDETTVTVEPFALSMVPGALTSALVDRVPDFIEGWETKLYIDSFGGTARSTAIATTLINWDVEIDNQLARKYFADNTLNAAAITVGEIAVKAKFLVEAASSQATTELSNFDGVTRRLVGLEFGQNEVISGSDKKFVTVDIPGAWEAVDLGQKDENTRAYELSLQYLYDPTNAYGLQIRAQNARSTAY
jgi:hypothetical protein